MSDEQIKIILSEPIRLTPFANPADYLDYFIKEYSEVEIYSFVRFLRYETNFFSPNNNTYLGDYFEQWKSRQKQKIWD